MFNYWPLRDKNRVKANEAKEVGTSEHGRCLLCGANIQRPQKAVFVWEHLGGGVLVTEEEGKRLNAEGHGSSDLGYQPIGPECFRKHRAVLEPYAGKASLARMGKTQEETPLSERSMSMTRR